MNLRNAESQSLANCMRATNAICFGHVSENTLCRRINALRFYLNLPTGYLKYIREV